MVFLVTCIVLFEALNDAFIMLYFRASFLHPITETDSMQGHAAQIFKVETLLNKTFTGLYNKTLHNADSNIICKVTYIYRIINELLSA